MAVPRAAVAGCASALDAERRDPFMAALLFVAVRLRLLLLAVRVV